LVEGSEIQSKSKVCTPKNRRVERRDRASGFAPDDRIVRLCSFATGA